MKNLTTFDKCKIIRNSLLTRVGEALAYESWDDDFRIKNIKNIYDSIQHWEKTNGSFKIDPTDLTFEEMEQLGFGVWSKDNPMRLIPIWLFSFLCAEFNSESISGSKHTKLSEIDSDHRMGCLAYGVIPKIST